MSTGDIYPDKGTYSSSDEKLKSLEREVELLRELIALKERLAKVEKSIPYVPYIPVAPVQPYVPYPDPWRPWITYTGDSIIVDGNRIIS